MIRYSPKFKQVIIQGQSNTFYGFQSQKFKKRQNKNEYETKHLDGLHYTSIDCQESSSSERTSEKSEGLNDPQPKVPNISWLETVIIIKVVPCILEDDVDCSIY